MKKQFKARIEKNGIVDLFTNILADMLENLGEPQSEETSTQCLENVARAIGLESDDSDGLSMTSGPSTSPSDTGLESDFLSQTTVSPSDSSLMEHARPNVTEKFKFSRSDNLWKLWLIVLQEIWH